MEHPFYIACALLNRPQNEDNTHYNLGTSLYQNGTHEDVCFITLYYIFPRRLWQKLHDFKCSKCENCFHETEGVIRSQNESYTFC